MTDAVTSPPVLLVLIGPTAIGKTALSLELAESFNAEIISVDSMQVYRKMDVGTAKASAQELTRVPHHLINIIDPDEAYDAARFIVDAEAAITEISQRGRVVLLTGGTGLYLRALFQGLADAPPIHPELRQHLHQRLHSEGRNALFQELSKLDPESAARIHPNDSQRLVRALEIALHTGKPWSKHIENQGNRNRKFNNYLQIGLRCERSQLYKRINLRTSLMMQQGLEEEVRNLINMGYSPELKSMQSIGYRHFVNYIQGSWSLEECERLLARDTRRYAKRQFTWFGRDKSIKWFERRDREGVMTEVGRWLENQRYNINK